MSHKTVTSSHRIGLLALAAGVFAFAHAQSPPIQSKSALRSSNLPPARCRRVLRSRMGSKSRPRSSMTRRRCWAADRARFRGYRGNSEKARAAVEKLITRDKVVAVVGEQREARRCWPR